MRLAKTAEPHPIMGDAAVDGGDPILDIFVDKS